MSWNSWVRREKKPLLELTDLIRKKRTSDAIDTGSTGIGGWERCQAVYA